MTMLFNKYVLTFLFFSGAWFASYGQLSIDVGYMGNVWLNNGFRSPINAFNEQLPQDAKSMSRFNYLNGIHIGLSSGHQPLVFGIEYNGILASASAKNLLNSSGTKYNFLLNYAVNGGGLSVGGLMGNFSVGTAALYNFYHIKQFNTIDNERNTMAKGRGIALKPWIGYRIGAMDDRLGGAFRLFLTYPLYDIDLTKLNQTLAPGISPTDDPQWKSTTIGLSFILMNRR